MLKIYSYSNCGTCRKALKHLDNLKIPYKAIPIREQVPSVDEITRMVNAYGGITRKLFNTSGQSYRAAGLKDILPKLSQAEAIELLRRDGNLIKRPFVIGKDVAMVGYNQAEWDKAFN